MAVPELTDNRANSRFEASVSGSLAGFADYEKRGEALVFTHTGVDPAHRGHGIGSALARYGLDQARRQHVQVVPLCSFIAGWIERHPDYGDLTELDVPRA